MPPRKRARVSQATSPDRETEPTPAKDPTPAVTTPSKTDDAAILDDPWTDGEDIGLFKGLMRWKPTGIHKHFRLIALHAWLLQNGYIHPRNAHTRPAGIWAKLRTLYDLEKLDAREDARQLDEMITSAEAQVQQEVDEDADVYSIAANKIANDDFDLSAYGEGFDEIMWKRRLPDEKGDESEPELPELNLAEEAPVRFVPSFSIEPSENTTPSSRKGKGTSAKGKGAKSGATATRRSRRKTEETEETGGNEEGGEEEESEVDEGESEEESQRSTPGPRRGRSSKPTRSKVAGRGRTRGRGRGK